MQNPHLLRRSAQTYKYSTFAMEEIIPVRIRTRTRETVGLCVFGL